MSSQLIIHLALRGNSIVIPKNANLLGSGIIGSCVGMLLGSDIGTVGGFITRPGVAGAADGITGSYLGG